MTLAMGDDDGPLMGGMYFTSVGGYGSIYDPHVFADATEFLEIALCDECVVAGAGDGLVQEGRPQSRPDTVYTAWIPPVVNPPGSLGQ